MFKNVFCAILGHQWRPWPRQPEGADLKGDKSAFYICDRCLVIGQGPEHD
jgi:hypothetical protein